ncbi:hypothetical protein GV64_05950 [Endozoicomonas elysicola]|uniref:Uncharacterized protein n=2 Tax=Endozoicomonas elysicola TaxID=305900 RepID=A0A081K856_9GAMM|nr:hypothetical protein GV64_05950 [Endozoicomonas elysicola]
MNLGSQGVVPYSASSLHRQPYAVSEMPQSINLFKRPVTISSSGTTDLYTGTRVFQYSEADLASQAEQMSFADKEPATRSKRAITTSANNDVPDTDMRNFPAVDHWNNQLAEEQGKVSQPVEKLAVSTGLQRSAAFRHQSPAGRVCPNDTRSLSRAPFLQKNHQIWPEGQRGALSQFAGSQRPERNQSIAHVYSSSRHVPVRAEFIDSAKKTINAAYNSLKTNPLNAEAEFRKVYPTMLGSLNRKDQCRLVAGLARAIKDQGGIHNCQRAVETILKFKGERVHPTVPSGFHSLDITLAKAWEGLGIYRWAEMLLLAMVNRGRFVPVDVLSQPTGNRDIDLALIMLWQAMGKQDLAQKLLMAIRVKNPNQMQLAIADKNPEMTKEDAETILCKPTGDSDLDLAQARLWESMKQYALAETLLLLMSGKDPYELRLAMVGKNPRMTKANAEAVLCTLSGKQNMDLARLWQAMDKKELAENLFLVMAGKNPKELKLAMAGENPRMTAEEAEAVLCHPSDKHDINLALARLWEDMEKYDEAENLLLAMAGKNPKELRLAMAGENPGMTKEEAEVVLCEPSSKYDVNLALVMLWGIMDKQALAEKLRAAAGMPSLKKSVS